MTRAVGNGMIQTLANAIGTGAVGKLAKQIAGLSTDVANIKTPDKGSGLMFNPETGKLYIPCGNGVTVNKNTGMLEVPIGDNLHYTGSGLDVPDADETTAGVVKLTHEVSNRDDGEWAVTSDGVYAYGPGYKTPYADIADLVTLRSGSLANAVVSGGILFLNAHGIKNWAHNEVAITIEGYAVLGTYTYYGAAHGNDCAYFNCLYRNNRLVLEPQNDLTEGTISITVPVYKL